MVESSIRYQILMDLHAHLKVNVASVARYEIAENIRDNVMNNISDRLLVNIDIAIDGAHPNLDQS